MKKAIIFISIIFVSACFICSCSDDNNNNANPTIDGEWKADILTIFSEKYYEDIDPYVKKAFNDVLADKKIRRVFDDESKSVTTFYIDEENPIEQYFTETYEIKKDSLYLKNGNTVSVYHFSVSEHILTNQWKVNRDQLAAILSKMDKAPVAAMLPDDYEGTIKFVEKR